MEKQTVDRNGFFPIEASRPALRNHCSQGSRWTLFKLVELYLWRIERYIRGKQAWFWQLLAYFDLFRRIWRKYGRQVSRKTVAKSLAACDSRRLHEEDQLRFSNSKHFCFNIEQRNISFQNDISLKTMRLGVLRWEKLKSWAWTSSGVEVQMLIFSSLSLGRVKKFQKFINFRLKIAHSANLKHSKSTWGQLIVLWKVQQNHNIKSSGHNASSVLLVDRGTGTIDLRQLSFWYRAVSCWAD